MQFTQLIVLLTHLSTDQTSIDMIKPTKLNVFFTFVVGIVTAFRPMTDAFLGDISDLLRSMPR